MFDTNDTQYRPTFTEVGSAPLGTPGFEATAVDAPKAEPRVEATTEASEVNDQDGENGRWHSEAGRKGAHRVHQLIQEGRLYEQEHGLKSGRQRLRQLIELGKLYEQEHGIQPKEPKKSGRLSRGERQELLSTLVDCLIRIAKPSFRAELARLAEALKDPNSSAA